MDDALLRIASSLRPARLLVLGDMMLDRTRWVRSGRFVSDKAAFVAEQDSIIDQPGGAAYVATLLSGFGSQVIAAGAIGDDAEGLELTRQLTALGIEPLLVEDPIRPTTRKERFVIPQQAAPQTLLRIDREFTGPIPVPLETELRDLLAARLGDCDGIVISDYAKGVCTPMLVTTIIETAHRRGIPVVVDPARRSSSEHYTGCDVITPNRREAEAATGISIRTAVEAARAGRRICAEVKPRACVITLDADGAVLTLANGETRTIPAHAQGVLDPTGAGDAFAASLVQALASRRDLEESVRFANFVAGLQVQRFGAAPVTLHELIAALHARPPARTAAKCVSLAELEAAVARRRGAGERIVLTNGCFDLLHAGHVGYLEDAAAEGDCLIVAVNADRTVARLKGNSRPVMPEDDRTRLLAALACVDHVVIFGEPTPHEVIRRLQPDVLVKGGDYAAQDIVGRELVEAYGGTVKSLGLTPGLSTTQILKRLATAPLRVSHAG